MFYLKKIGGIFKNELVSVDVIKFTLKNKNGFFKRIYLTLTENFEHFFF